ncbi:hypothetical protein [EBPR siphovirus 5]|nr:hypothetical protein [EBPR siphovirus 5]
MTHAELIAHVSAGCGLPKRDAHRVVDDLAKTILLALSKGDEVTIPGVGKLHVVDRAARTGTNPATGASVDIPAKRVAKLRMATELRRALV